MFKSTFALVASLLLVGAPPLMGHPPVKTYDSIMGSHPMMSHNPMMDRSHMKSHDSMMGRHPMKCHDSMMDLSHMMSHIFNYIRNHPMMSHISNYIRNHKMRLNDIVHGPVHQPIPTQEQGHGGGHLNPDHTDIVHGPVHQTLPTQGPGHGGGYQNLNPKGNCNSSEGFFMVPNSNNQCFKNFTNKARTWDESKTLCEYQGLRLAEPRDPQSLRKYTQENFGDYKLWLGARGDNSSVRWISDGTAIANDSNLWHDNGVDFTLTSYCLELMSTSWGFEGGPYRMSWCETSGTYYALCELVTPEPPTTTTPVPDGFENFNGRIIRRTVISDRRASWDDAMLSCNMYEAKPFIPYNQEEYDLYKTVRYSLDRHMWLPANDILEEGTLRWYNGQVATNISMWDWYDGREMAFNSDIDDCLKYGFEGNSPAVYLVNCTNLDYPPICEIL